MGCRSALRGWTIASQPGTARRRIGGIGGGVTITADAAFRHLQVYTPRQHDFFCVEPVSHVPDAINRPDLPPGQGMHVLQPGATLSGIITIALLAGA